MILIKGKTKDNAIKLLGAAAKLGLPGDVVKSVYNGFLVPEEVAAEMESADAAEKAPAQTKTTRSKKAKTDVEANDTKEGKE